MFLRGLFKGIKGKKKTSDQDRKKLERERQIYEDERLKSLEGIDPDSKRYQDDEKVLKQSGGQDISAI